MLTHYGFTLLVTTKGVFQGNRRARTGDETQALGGFRLLCALWAPHESFKTLLDTLKSIETPRASTRRAEFPTRFRHAKETRQQGRGVVW